MRRKVSIIGAGISGLTSAYLFQKKGWDVEVFEEKSRIGGWIDTYDDGTFLFEKGPKGCRPKGKGLYFLRLVEDLGIEDQLVEASDQSAIRYVLTPEGLKTVPSDAIKFLKSLKEPFWLKGYFQILGGLFKANNLSQDLSVEEFFSNKIGSHLTKNLIKPFCYGIYGQSCDQLSMQMAFPSFFKQLKKIHSEKIFVLKNKNRTKSPLLSFKKGMVSLVDALGSKLENSIHLKTKVEKATFSNNKWVLKTSEGSSSSDVLICSSGMLSTSKILEVNPISNNFVSLRVVHLGWKSWKWPKDGFGFLAANPKDGLLGVVFDHNIFVEHTKNLESKITVMLSEELNRWLETCSEDELIKLVLEQLKVYFGAIPSPDFCLVHQAKNAFTTLSVNYLEKLENWKKQIDGQTSPIAVIGVKGIGVNYAIETAYQLSSLFEEDCSLTNVGTLLI